MLKNFSLMYSVALLRRPLPREEPRELHPLFLEHTEQVVNLAAVNRREEEIHAQSLAFGERQVRNVPPLGRLLPAQLPVPDERNLATHMCEPHPYTRENKGESGTSEARRCEARRCEACERRAVRWSRRRPLSRPCACLPPPSPLTPLNLCRSCTHHAFVPIPEPFIGPSLPRPPSCCTL